MDQEPTTKPAVRIADLTTHAAMLLEAHADEYRGKTSRAFATMDSPKWWNSMWYRNAMMSSLNRAVLRYAGIKPRGSTVFTPVRSSTPEIRNRWLAVVARRARQDAHIAGKSQH